MTPTDEFSQSHVAIVGQSEVPQDFDLTSMFLSYPGLMGCEDASYAQLAKDGQREQLCFTKQQGGHCGCLHESTSYNVVLELSLRLRKAADVLARSASHHMGSNCLLNQHIIDLDTFATCVISHCNFPSRYLTAIQQKHIGKYPRASWRHAIAFDVAGSFTFKQFDIYHGTLK
jgi:hypothetical protein